MLFRNLLIGIINNLKDQDQIGRSCSLLHRYDAFSEAYDELNNRYQKELDRINKTVDTPTLQHIRLISLYLNYVHKLLDTLDLDFLVDETISLHQTLYQQLESSTDADADADADSDSTVNPLQGVDP